MSSLKLICLVALIGISFGDPVPKTIEYFGYIFDAGSTGTRLNIYQILVDNKAGSKKKPNKNYPVKFIEKINCNIAFTEQTDLKNAEKELDTCIENAGKAVTAIAKDHLIWMKFAGTGGLRTLRNSNKKKFEELMNGIKKYFKNKKTINPRHLDFVEVVEDNTEAEYDYIASIYKEGTETVEEKGVIDIGGSSFQVALPISANSKFPSFITKQVTQLFEKDYNFGILNFKCGGQKNIKYYYLSRLIEESNDLSKPINSPCHPTQFSQKIKTKNFLNECTKNVLGNLKLPDEITINGANNEAVCTQKLKEAFCSDDDAKRENKCIIDDPKNIPISVSEKIKINLLGSWVYFSKELAASDYTELVAKMTDMFNRNDCLSNNVERCFSSKYLKFITNFFIKPTDQAAVSVTAPSWTLGKMLVDTKFLFSKSSKTVIIIVVILTLMFISAGLLLSWHFCYKRGKSAIRR